MVTKEIVVNLISVKWSDPFQGEDMVSMESCSFGKMKIVRLTRYLFQSTLCVSLASDHPGLLRLAMHLKT